MDEVPSVRVEPRRVYVVEDDEMLRKTLRRGLQRLGYVVIGESSSGEDAIEQIPLAQPDIIVMDIGLSGAFTGVQVAARLRGVVDIPIVFLTGSTSTEFAKLAGETGSFGYVVKPASAEVLAATLEMAAVKHAAEVRLRQARLELEQVNTKLRESEEGYRSLFEEAIEGVFRMQLDGTLVAANPAFARIVGYDSANELLGRSVFTLFASHEDKRRASAAWMRGEVLEGMDVAWRTRTGEQITIELFGRVLGAPSSPLAFFQGFVRDVTALRIIEGSPMAFWDWNPKTGAVTSNERCAEMLGYRGSELDPHIETYVARIHPDDRSHYDEAMRAHLQGDRSLFEAVHRMRHRDGRWLYVLNKGKVFARDASGQPTRFCGTYTDISVEKEAERAALEANQAKTHFLASMSHELRTPLNAILGLSDALLQRTYGSLTANQDRSLHTINASGRHLLDLINDVLDVASIEAGQFRIDMIDVALAPIVGECIAFVIELAEARRQRLVTAFDPSLVTVRADPRRLRQVLINLLTNAIKFSTEGDTIVVAARQLPSGQVELSVTDSGPGIATRDRERVFEPFVTLDPSRQSGAGLGLSLVKRIVERQGGTVRIEGEPESGTRFVVTLHPRTAEEELSSASRRS